METDKEDELPAPRKKRKPAKKTRDIKFYVVGVVLAVILAVTIAEIGIAVRNGTNVNTGAIERLLDRVTGLLGPDNEDR